jgi:colanic acid/amylovoran biosynthesis glycosyltransferase
MRHENVRAIHAHYGPLGCEYLPLSTSLQIPLITSFYGFDLSVDKVINDYEKNYRDLFEKGSRFLVEGHCMRNKLISIGCPKKKISIQRISLDLRNYKLKSCSFDSNRPIKILFVGRFVEKKGLEYAFRALAAIKNEFTIEFRVIGDGELKDTLKKIAYDLGFNKEIKWLGMQPYGKVIEELSICDFLLQPSVTARNGDSEGGAPTIILEAQACGVPVISTSHADIPYITIPGESALLSDEKDVEVLSFNIKRLLSNPETWEKMGRKGRQYVEQNHDIKKQILNLENIYRKHIIKKTKI